MKKMMNKVSRKATEIYAKVITKLQDNTGGDFIETAIKVLIAVVVGALLLAGMYMLFNDIVLPTVTQRIKDMFDYAP